MSEDLGRIRWVKMPWLHHEATGVFLDADIANLLDVGFVFRAGDELVRVIGIAGVVGEGSNLGEPCNVFRLELERAYNGSIRQTHTDGPWEVVIAPEYRWGE